MIIGLTGSLGSGKSTVSRLFEQMAHAVVLDTDVIVHELQQPGMPGYVAIRENFGAEVFTADGLLDRKALAARVFGDPAELERLNALIHPLVLTETSNRLQMVEKGRLAVVVVPLLFEVGMDRLADKTVTVTLDNEVRFERLFQRDGMTRIEAERRLAAQLPQAEKVRRSDFVIDNSGTLDEMRRQVAEILATLDVAPATAS